MDRISYSGGSPKCPNHGCTLEGFKIGENKGTGMCPVSGCWFDFEACGQEQMTFKDSNGQITIGKKFCVEGQD